MITYKIEYHNHTIYDGMVNDAIYEFNIMPKTGNTQTVRNYEIDHTLRNEATIFKNKYKCDAIRIRTAKPFSELEFHFEAFVDKREENPFAFKSQNPDEEWLHLHSDLFQINHVQFIKCTKITTLSKDENKNFPAYIKGDSLFTYIQNLTSEIYRNTEYMVHKRDVNDTAAETLSLKKGGSQDIAHLLIAILRSNQIPARLASGYLDQSANFQGSGYIHSWVEAYIPGIGWKGFDPSHNLVADNHYIKVSNGTDYKECKSLKGILSTSGNYKQKSSEYNVKVYQIRQDEQDS